MRATLEQLKAVSNDELERMWWVGLFPFDHATCSNCVSQHGQGMCARSEHQEFSKQAPRHPGCANLHEYLEEFYALRMFFDSLYPQAVEAVEEKTTTELAPSLVAQG